MTIKELFEARARVYAQMTELNARSEWSDDDRAKWDALNVDYTNLDKRVAAAQQMHTLAEQNKADVEQRLETQPKPSDAAKDFEARQIDTWREYLLRGDKAIDGEAKNLLMTLRKAGDSVKAWEKRGTNVIAGEVSATYGGYLIPITVWTELERRMKMFGGMLQACRTINTDTGGTLYWPTNDDTTATGNWLAEPRASALTVEDTVFNRVTYNSYTWGTLAKFSIEIMQDESVNLFMEQFMEIMSERAGRALNASFTTGNGTGKPTGLLTSTSAGKTAASATAITKAEIIDLIHSIDPAYRTGPNVAFMMHDSVLAYIRKLDVGSSDTIPLWQPSMQLGVPDRLFGYPVYINQDMDSTVAATKKTMVFGDFSKYIIREVARPSTFIMQERYMDELHKGIVMWCRYDGKLLQSNAIKHFLQS